MGKSSINIKPIKNSSEQHNQRVVELDYVLPKEHIKKENDSFITDTVENRFKTISGRYKKSTGQKMQTKATPIREAVINLKQGADMDDLMLLGSELEKEFNIKPFQYYIHDDEGHIDQGEVKFNRHAHIVFDWTDTKTGKSLKLDRFDMSKMQDIVADTLAMERGESSSKVHLNSLQFKIQAEERKLLYITEKRKQIIAKTDDLMKGITSEKEIQDKIIKEFKPKSSEEIRNRDKGVGM
tara:strand:+ start:163 stop:879 length:717 start_codon:yes stop_codon:yes gene_type:complete